MAYAPTDFASRENAFTQSPTFTQTSAQTSMPSARRWPGPVFARARVFLVLIWEAFAEGQEMSRLAHKRYPFAEW